MWVNTSMPWFTGIAMSAWVSPSRSPVVIPPPAMTSVGSAAESVNERSAVWEKTTSVSPNGDESPNEKAMSLRPSPSRSATPTDPVGKPKPSSSGEAKVGGAERDVTEIVYDAVLALRLRTRTK